MYKERLFDVLIVHCGEAFDAITGLMDNFECTSELLKNSSNVNANVNTGRHRFQLKYFTLPFCDALLCRLCTQLV